MKNLFLLLTVVFMSVSCEKENIDEEIVQEETANTELYYAIDKGDIVRPGDKPN